MAVKIRGKKGTTGGIPRDPLGAEINLSYDAWETVLSPEDPSYFITLLTAIEAAAPASVQGLPRADISFQEDTEGSSHWSFDVKYAARTPSDSQIRWSWDTTGGTVRLFTSKQTTRYAISGRTAPNHGGSIGVVRGEVEGVDKVIPALKLTATYRHLQAGAINDGNYQSYIKSLASMTGTTNSVAWQTYAIGELLFLGSTGEYVTGKDTEIQYHFAASANATGLTIGAIASVAKKGHEYLWVSFEASEDASAIARKPTFCYVEKIYGETDFNTLGIG
jgi:hypothetical protein